jgi:anti-sigma B factor antagonist
MKYSIDKQEKYVVFTLHEDNLNSILAPNLKTEFKLIYEEGYINFILDLSDVKFVDSSGLSAILTAKRIWDDIGNFVLTGVNNASVKRLIEISKLNDVLNIVPSVEEAIDHIFMEEIQNELNDED